jgi:hypothetical protein
MGNNSSVKKEDVSRLEAIGRLMELGVPIESLQTILRAFRRAYKAGRRDAIKKIHSLS